MSRTEKTFGFFLNLKAKWNEEVKCKNFETKTFNSSKSVSKAKRKVEVYSKISEQTKNLVFEIKNVISKTKRSISVPDKASYIRG
jgi:hypothetical protein